MVTYTTVLYISTLLAFAAGVRLDDDEGAGLDTDYEIDWSTGGYSNGGVYKSVSQKYNEDILVGQKERDEELKRFEEAEAEMKAEKAKASEARSNYDKAWGTQVQEERLLKDAHIRVRDGTIAKNKAIKDVTTLADQAKALKAQADIDSGSEAAITVKVKLFNVKEGLKFMEGATSDRKTEMTAALEAAVALASKLNGTDGIVKALNATMVEAVVTNGDLLQAIIEPTHASGSQLSATDLDIIVKELEEGTVLNKGVADVVKGVLTTAGQSVEGVVAGQIVVSIVKNMGKYMKAFRATGCPKMGPIKEMTWWLTQDDQTVWANMNHLCEMNRDGTANERQVMECCGTPSGCNPICKRQQAWEEGQTEEQIAASEDRKQQLLEQAEEALSKQRDAEDDIEAQTKIVAQSKLDIENRKRQVVRAKALVRKSDWKKWIAQTKAINEAYSMAWSKKLKMDSEAKISMLVRKKSEALESMIAEDGKDSYKNQEDSKTTMNNMDAMVVKLQKDNIQDEAMQLKRVDDDQKFVAKKEEVLAEALDAAAQKRAAHKHAMNAGGTSEADKRQANKKKAAIRMCTTTGDYGSTVPAHTACHIDEGDVMTFQCNKDTSDSTSDKYFGPQGWCHTNPDDLTKWGACSDGCSAAGKWVASAHDVYCSPDLRKTLSTTKFGLVDHPRQCMALAAEDHECGNEIFTNGDNCVCVIKDKRCDRLAQAGMDLFEYVDEIDAIKLTYKKDMEWEAGNARKLKEHLVTAEEEAAKTIADFEARQEANRQGVIEAYKNRREAKTKLANAEEQEEKVEAALGKSEVKTDLTSNVEGKSREDTTLQNVYASHAATKSAAADLKLHTHLMITAKANYEDALRNKVQNEKDIVIDQKTIEEANLTAKVKKGDQMSAEHMEDIPWALGYVHERTEAEKREADARTQLAKDESLKKDYVKQYDEDLGNFNTEQKWIDGANGEKERADKWEAQAKEHFEALEVHVAGQKAKMKDEKVKRMEKIIAQEAKASEEAEDNKQRAETEAETHMVAEQSSAVSAAKIGSTNLKLAHQMLAEAEDPKAKANARTMLKEAKKLKAFYLKQEVEEKKMKIEKEDEAAELTIHFNKHKLVETRSIEKKDKIIKDWEEGTHPPTAWPTPAPTSAPTHPPPTPLPTPVPSFGTPSPTEASMALPV